MSRRDSPEAPRPPESGGQSEEQGRTREKLTVTKEEQAQQEKSVLTAADGTTP